MYDILRFWWIYFNRLLLAILGYSFIPDLGEELEETSEDVQRMHAKYEIAHPNLSFTRGTISGVIKDLGESILCILFEPSEETNSLAMHDQLVSFLAGHRVLLHVIDDSKIHGFLSNPSNHHLFFSASKGQGPLGTLPSNHSQDRL